MVLFVTLFLAVQGISQAHATSNGGEDHSHDGVACDVMLVAAEQVVLTPPPAEPAPFNGVDQKRKVPLQSDPLNLNFSGRAPPPRGPPL